MAIDRSIFDKYQKTLINPNYVDLNDTSNIIYVEDQEVVKLMTPEEYLGMESLMRDREINEDAVQTASGLIETTFANSAQTATSFTRSVRFFEEKVTDEAFRDIIDKSEGLT
jgi:hypothetical protein